MQRPAAAIPVGIQIGMRQQTRDFCVHAKFYLERFILTPSRRNDNPADTCNGDQILKIRGSVPPLDRSERNCVHWSTSSVYALTPNFTRIGLFRALEGRKTC